MDEAIIAEIRAKPNLFYVYLLFRPNGKPFYVGKGKGNRIFDHEKEARTPDGKIRYVNRIKINVMRKIWRNGGEIGYLIDSWHLLEESALDREIRLISKYGRIADNKGGILANLTEGGDGLIRPPKSVLKRMSDSQKKRFEDPELRKMVAETQRRVLQEHPELIERSSELFTELWKDNDWRERILSVRQQWIESEEAKEVFKKAAEARQKWREENPEEFQEACRKATEFLRSDANRTRQSEDIRKWREENPAAVAEMERKRIETLRSEEFREFRSRQVKNHYWSKILNGTLKPPKYISSKKGAKIEYPLCLFPERKTVHLGRSGSTKSIIRYYQHTYRIRIMLRRLAEKLHSEKESSQ